MKVMLRALATLAVAAALTSPALAADFNTPIVNLDGSPVLGDDKQPLSLATVAESALLLSYVDEQNTITGNEKVRRWMLANTIRHEPKNPTLTSEDITTIKNLIAKAYSPVVVGQAWQLLDPATTAAKP